jgi:hypothetical protein
VAVVAHDLDHRAGRDGRGAAPPPPLAGAERVRARRTGPSGGVLSSRESYFSVTS